VREVNGLGALQVGISRHDEIDMFLGETEERRLQFLKLRRRLPDLIFDVESQIKRDLVVATARGVLLRAGFTDSFGEHALDVHVDVLERFVPLKFSGLDFLLNLAQPGFDFFRSAAEIIPALVRAAA